MSHETKLGYVFWSSSIQRKLRLSLIGPRSVVLDRFHGHSILLWLSYCSNTCLPKWLTRYYPTFLWASTGILKDMETPGPEVRIVPHLSQPVPILTSWFPPSASQSHSLAFMVFHWDRNQPVPNPHRTGVNPAVAFTILVQVASAYFHTLINLVGLPTIHRESIQVSLSIKNSEGHTIAA